MFGSGLNALVNGGLSIHSQVRNLSVGSNSLIPNPLRRPDGTVIPVTETATVKNANADGTLNPTGSYIKLVDTYGNGSVNVNWSTTFNRGNLVNNLFSGRLAITYTLPQRDLTIPVFTPASPAKITSRKGVSIQAAVNEVIAEDNPGGSGLNAAGITNNAGAIGLNLTNPAAGNYTLVYSATDMQNNTATVNRAVEITDADTLQARVNAVTPAMLDGMTATTVAEVNARRQAAEAVISNNSSTQAAINQALADLNAAIDALRADKAPLAQAITDHNAQPAHIQNDALVAAALTEANRVNNLPNPSPTEVRQTAQALRDAITQAIADETNRQNQATTALDTAEVDPSPTLLDNAQTRINAVQDPAVKQQMQARFDAMRTRYQNRRVELQALIHRAGLPATIDGMTATTVTAMQVVLQNVTNGFTANLSLSGIDQLFDDLTAALDGLRADKTNLVAAITNAAAQPDAIRNNPAVVAALAAANATNNEANPSVADVRARTDALNNAIRAARLGILRALIDRAELPATTDGMTDATVHDLRSEVVLARAIYGDTTATDDEIDQEIADLQAALDALRADKQPLIDAITEEAAQSDAIRNNPAVVAALAAVNAANSDPNPSVADVRARARALRDAIAAAIAAQNNQAAGGVGQNQGLGTNSTAQLAATGLSLFATFAAAAGTVGSGAALIVKKRRDRK